jgi:hypothetical protein
MNMIDIIIIGVAVLAIGCLVAGVYWDGKFGFGSKRDESEK